MHEQIIEKYSIHTVASDCSIISKHPLATDKKAYPSRHITSVGLSRRSFFYSFNLSDYINLAWFVAERWHFH